MVDAVEDVLRSPIPELAVIEHGVDDGGSVARLDAAGIQRTDEESIRVEFISGMMNALRGHDIGAVGGQIESAADVRVGESGQRKVEGLELDVRARKDRP